MEKTILHRLVRALGLAALALAMAPPGDSRADIYRWEDESGVVHFTDDIGNIPPRFRSRQTPILKGPPAAGQPSLSTIEAPPPRPFDASPVPGIGAAPEPSTGIGEEVAGEVEQLRAKIAAKEQFVEGVDRKRSNIRNPLGNRFVAQEDLELYAKYKQELPQDRERLRDLESRLPAVR